MVLIAPRNSWRDRYVSFHPEGWAVQGVVIVAPREAEILIDGEPAGEPQAIGETGFIQLAVPQGEGTHRVQSDVPIYVIQRGLNNFASYAMPAQ